MKLKWEGYDRGMSHSGKASIHGFCKAHDITEGLRSKVV